MWRIFLVLLARTPLALLVPNARKPPLGMTKLLLTLPNQPGEAAWLVQSLVPLAPTVMLPALPPLPASIATDRLQMRIDLTRAKLLDVLLSMFVKLVRSIWALPAAAMLASWTRPWS